MVTIHFKWKDEYSVNVKIIDEQHKKLIEIIDMLYQSILIGKEKERLLEIFKQLNKYVDFHFSTEEKYFKKFDYKEAVSHIAIHKKFTKDILEMETKINDENFNALELLLFLENWWTDHILNIDKRYSKTFNEHGLK